jgi:hypothetical protein
MFNIQYVPQVLEVATGKKEGARIQDLEVRLVEGERERPGYDLLKFFKKITRLTKTEVYLCDLRDPRLGPCRLPGHRRLSELSASTMRLYCRAQRTPLRSNYNGYRLIRSAQATSPGFRGVASF